MTRLGKMPLDGVNAAKLRVNAKRSSMLLRILVQHLESYQRQDPG
jgi:hypothetical protein